MPFDPELVPVAHEHRVDVIHEVGNGKHDVSAGEPMPVERGGRKAGFKNKQRREQISTTHMSK